jgi:hypothetical protein
MRSSKFRYRNPPRFRVEKLAICRSLAVTHLERDDRPIAYWLAVAFFFLYGAFLIVLGLNR